MRYMRLYRPCFRAIAITALLLPLGSVGCLESRSPEELESTATTLQTLTDGDRDDSSDEAAPQLREDRAAPEDTLEESENIESDEAPEQDGGWDSDPDPEPWQPEAP